MGSDTLARKLIAKGEGHKLNFPEDHTEVHTEKRRKASEFFGVYYSKKRNRWVSGRWSKTEKKYLINGAHREEDTAAHASDTLARNLMANGDRNFKLNFPDDSIEVHANKLQTKKRKRPSEFGDSQTDENDSEKFQKKKSEDSPKYSAAFLGSGFKNN